MSMIQLPLTLTEYKKYYRFVIAVRKIQTGFMMLLAENNGVGNFSLSLILPYEINQISIWLENKLKYKSMLGNLMTYLFLFMYVCR